MSDDESADKQQQSNGNSSAATTSKQSSEQAATAATATSSKRNFLEVNDLEKYKQFLLKQPQIDTKRFKPSEALSKVKDFLPLLKESTNKLLDEYKENPDELNIENVDDEEQHIEMNLALVSESDSDDEDDDDDDEEEYDDDDDDDDDNDEVDREDPNYKSLNLGIRVKDVTQLNKLKLPESCTIGKKYKKTKRPFIQVLEESNDKNNDNEQEDEEDEEDEENASEPKTETNGKASN